MKYFLFAFSFLLLSIASAQPRSSVSKSDASAPGVTLSELTTFTNRESISNTIMPFGSDFFISTTEDERQVTPLGGISGGAFVELKDLTLYRYANTMRLKEEITVSWPNEAREHGNIVTVGENFIWTFATLSGRKDFIELQAEVLDQKAKLVSKHKLMLVDKKDYHQLAAFEDYTPSRSHYVRVYAEESSNRILSKRDDEAATINVIVFNQQGELISNEKSRLRVNRDQLDIQDVAVDELGRAYILAKVLGNTRGRETRGGSDAKIMLYTLAAGATEIEDTEIKIDGQYIEGIALVPSIGSAPAIAGIYSDKVGGRVNGYFSSDNARSGQLLKPIPFSEKQLIELGRRATSKTGRGLGLDRTFVFRDAKRLSNGELSILLESQWQTISTSSGGAVGMGGMGNQRITYYYGDGLLLNFDRNGTLDQLLIVPKLQATQMPNPPYARMNIVEYENKAGVIYNDNPKNFVRDPNKRIKGLRWSDALAVIAFTDSRGELQRIPLFGSKDTDKVILLPKTATRLADNRVVFLAARYRSLSKNELRFGLISPKD